VADSDKDRQRRMEAALAKIRAKNQSKAAKAKRNNKAAKLRRNMQGDD
jgi:hypothetical protein